jgi:sialate O-acetylesterase
MNKNVCLLLAGMCALSLSAAEFKVASLFTDNMVLQQGRKIPVWGTAEEGAEVVVRLNGKAAAARADRGNGKWTAWLPKMGPGGPYTLTVACGGRTLDLKNVLLGEVWIASGQSNMELALINARNGESEIAAANNPGIRFFTVERAASVKPLDAVKGAWQECTPQNAPGFSAVAYFYARQLRKDCGLNVGIIHTSWGGTPAEAWTDEATLAADPALAPLLDSFEAFKADAGRGTDAAERKMGEWNAFWDAEFMKQDALAGGWAAPEADPSEWTKTRVPGDVSVLADMDGVVWYRRDFDAPESWAGRDLTLRLGPIDDYDITYVNGTEVGRTQRDTPNWYMTPRVYSIPAGLVKPGRNTVAVRVLDSWLGGGFSGDPGLLTIAPGGAAAPEVLSLAGDWLSRIEFRFDPKIHPVHPETGGESQVPTLLYNAMIAPLIPYGIRGAIWYQGESNTSRFKQYRTLFPAMINGWRKAWNAAEPPSSGCCSLGRLFGGGRWMDGAFPFYFVQLANYMPRRDAPTESEWAALREAQTMTLGLKNTGMAVIIDIGEAADIHPRNKQDVGKRLALWAEAGVYGKKNLETSGPLYKGMKIEAGKVVISFDHAKSGLAVKDSGKPKGFAVAGADGKFVWADAEIRGGRIVVSSPQVPAPKAVRYAWADNPEANLINREGLPASPFRTDGP